MMGIERLAEIPLFAGLSESARCELAGGAVEREFARGETIWLEGDEPRGLFFVVSGQVRILGSRGARQYVVHTERTGATLGEVPLFAPGGYPATAVAAAPTRCIVIGMRPLRAAMAADPVLAWVLLEGLARRVRLLAARLESLTAGTVRSRLADYLLDRLALAPSDSIELGGTQEELAEELGTVREVVVRELAGLRRERILEATGRGGFRVADPDRLDSIARQDDG